jgi:hypothetical protein
MSAEANKQSVFSEAQKLLTQALDHVDKAIQITQETLLFVQKQLKGN